MDAFDADRILANGGGGAADGDVVSCLVDGCLAVPLTGDSAKLERNDFVVELAVVGDNFTTSIELLRVVVSAIVRICS